MSIKFYYGCLKKESNAVLVFVCLCLALHVMRILRTLVTHIVPIFSIYCIFLFVLLSLFFILRDLFSMCSYFLHHVHVQHHRTVYVCVWMRLYFHYALCIDGNRISSYASFSTVYNQEFTRLFFCTTILFKWNTDVRNFSTYFGFGSMFALIGNERTKLSLGFPIDRLVCVPQLKWMWKICCSWPIKTKEMPIYRRTIEHAKESNYNEINLCSFQVVFRTIYPPEDQINEIFRFADYIHGLFNLFIFFFTFRTVEYLFILLFSSVQKHSRKVYSD